VADVVTGRQSGPPHPHSAAGEALPVQHFSADFESESVTGTSNVSLAEERQQIDWGQRPLGGELSFAWPRQQATLHAEQDGTGRPWLVVRANAALEPESFSAGYAVTRSVEAVEQRRPGSWSVGDIARVTLHLRAQSDMTWVVVSDPVPGGGAILGSGLGRDSSIATEGERRANTVWPTHIERKFEWYRAYFDYLPKGDWTIEYTLRLNSSGEFRLPPTRVEAMYEPEVFGQSVNSPLEVEP
jgi:uncharacterized protein YfaS (alpha-2-macroglobulin family)